MKLNYKPEKGLLWQAPVVLIGLVAGAKMKVDVGAVPLTLQSLVLCFTCLYFSRQANLLGTFLYMLTGMYLPVFSSEIFGKEFYFGRTAGYIYGFPFAVILLTAAKQYFKDWFGVFAWILMTHAVIMIFGTAWGILYHKMDIDYALTNGFFNLLPGAIAKSVVVSLVYWLTRKYLKAETPA
ncbi:MAG: biotin transporter BioY [Bacteroidota bacterium]